MADQVRQRPEDRVIWLAPSAVKQQRHASQGRCIPFLLQAVATVTLPGAARGWTIRGLPRSGSGLGVGGAAPGAAPLAQTNDGGVAQVRLEAVACAQVVHERFQHAQVELLIVAAVGATWR